MIKKILFIQIISLILCACSSFPLIETKSTKIESVKLSQEEKDMIKLSKILFQELDNNWIQLEKYNNERISASFSIHLARDGSIESIKLRDSFCINDSNNECEAFVINAKKTILRTFPIKELLSINYSKWEWLQLSFGAKEGNELFKKTANKIKNSNQ